MFSWYSDIPGPSIVTKIAKEPYKTSCFLDILQFRVPDSPPEITETIIKPGDFDKFRRAKREKIHNFPQKPL